MALTPLFNSKMYPLVLRDYRILTTTTTTTTTTTNNNNNNNNNP